MAGIYFHIPFCKQACHYCDFHFSTNFRTINRLVSAMKQELVLQFNYVDQEPIETIYFGGGTPSAISPKYISELIALARKSFQVSPTAEISLETNPDDLTRANLEVWQKAGVNRLSVGVQSFYDDHLKWMNRAHDSQQAITGLKLAQELGITNITMDLIYGIPNMSMDQWKHNLHTFFDLGLPHLSAYGLTIESQTHLGHLVRNNKVKVEKDAMYNAQFEQLMTSAKAEGFDHYEISNFGKPGFYSVHNTSYWFGKKYVGIGPSAHSYNGVNRQWNVASNKKYEDGISAQNIPAELEVLSLNDQYNEYILTRLRTKWGVDIDQIKGQFGTAFQNNLMQLISPYEASGHVLKKQNSFVLSTTGKFLADKISSDLFIVA